MEFLIISKARPAANMAKSAGAHRLTRQSDAAGGCIQILFGYSHVEKPVRKLFGKFRSHGRLGKVSIHDYKIFIGLSYFYQGFSVSLSCRFLSAIICHPLPVFLLPQVRL